VLVYAIALGAAVIGLISAEAVVEGIHVQDTKLKKNVTLMRGLQSKVNQMVSQCENSDAAEAVKKFAEEILSGNVEIKPTRIKKETPCDYCAYKEICNFDRELGNRFKQISTMDNEAVFEQTKLF
jgi:ATP-dependent helicase/DNAse subunit B